MTEQALGEVSVQTATILVVEDDNSIQGVLQNILSMEGYAVRVAGSGQAALDILEYEVVDLVLLDVMLPDMNGYELCQHVRGTTLSGVPIMMLTALTLPQYVAQGLQSGADDYLKKPFDPRELLLRIEKLLRRRQESIGLVSENGTLRETLDLVQRQLVAARDESQTEATLRHEFLHNVTTHMRALVGIVDAEIRRQPPGLAREAVQRVKSRVRGVALVYEVSEALQSDPVVIGDVIRTISSALKTIYRPWKRILLSVEGEAVDVPLTIGAPLAMIVNELITNCFKHAFPENRFGAIKVRYGITDGMFFLDVADDGVGFTVTDPPRMGRTTVAQLVAGLDGTINWHSTTSGTCVSIELPLVP
jgi:DNA-binding response OmpR family regulator